MDENSSITLAQQPSGPTPDKLTHDAFVNEVRDAAALLEFAVSQGRTLEPTLIPRIKKSQGFLSTDAHWPSDEDRSNFESAYRDLAQAMQPVTAATLKATRYESWLGSPATQFSKNLYFWVFVCAALIVLDQILNPKLPIGAPGATPAPVAVTNFLEGLMASSRIKAASSTLQPFIYGEVGALTYLLRSAHSYIADRTFDLNRRPEYYNRMVLGFLAGGTVVVFGGQSTSAGPLAIAFLVGYNTDYLFQMIERLAQAIFPKDAKQSPIPGLGGLSLDKPTLPAGGAGNATITLTGPARSGGILVSLAADAGVVGS